MTQHIKIERDPQHGDVLPAAEPVGDHERCSNGMVALLLEDEPLICMDVEATLAAAGFDVFTVMSCAAAQAWLDGRWPDVVIVDIELVDGRCTNVASRLVQARIPFIVHTGDYRSMHADTPFAQGAWVSKPATPAALVQATRAAAADIFGYWHQARQKLN